MVDLHTHIAGRSGAVEHVNDTVFSFEQGLGRLLAADAQIDGSELGKRCQTCLEFSLLTLKHILKVLSQRHAVEGTHEQRLGVVLGIGHHSVRTLQHHAEQTALQHEGFYITLHFKLVRRLLAVSFHTNAEQLAAVTSFNLRDDTAHRRNKFHFRMQLVHKQGIPDLDFIALFHNRLGLYSAKIIGTERILLRHLHGQSFQSGSALELNVKTFAQLDYFCHYVLLNKYGFAPQKY